MIYPKWQQTKKNRRQAWIQ